MKRILLVTILSLILTTTFAQVSSQLDSLTQAKYRTKIAIDQTLPDFDTKEIDPTVKGSQLANILDFLIENYQQTVYNRQLAQILKEQEPLLEFVDLYFTKIKFLNAQKVGDETTIRFAVWLAKNSTDIKKVNLVFQFTKGVSDSQETNELFGEVSIFVQRRVCEL